VTYVFHDVLRIAGRWGLAPSLAGTLGRMVPRHDLVHIHWLFDFSSIAAARAAVAARVPFVLHPHGSLDPFLSRRNHHFKRLYLATIGRPLLSRAAALVFTAERERRQATYRPRRTEWVVPVGVDLTEFMPIPPPGTFRTAFPDVRGPFLLFLGRLSPQKGLDLLLGAFQKLLTRRPDLWLVIAGPDYRGYESTVRALAASLGVERRVVFPGLLSHQLKLGAFVDAELFVLPSYAENFGAVIIEALACGLPVVISDQVNIQQELNAAGVATVVQCGVGSVAEGIATTLDDTAFRARVRVDGPALVRREYTWDAIVPILIERYEQVLSEQ